MTEEEETEGVQTSVVDVVLEMVVEQTSVVGVETETVVELTLVVEMEMVVAQM